VASPTPNALLTVRNPSPEALPQSAVSLSGVTRVFGVTPALVRVDLDVPRGEMLVVRGPNGAGKSTLLRVIATVLSPTYGRGSVLGSDLVRGRDEIRRRMELIGHRTRLYEDLTGLENVACYSQGMRQRVAVARAWLRRPELLLLDEPYAGLDDEAKAIVDDLAAETAARGDTVILATHDRTRGGAAARTIYVDGGRVVPDPSDPAHTGPREAP
jgi:ABC-type multidrug transport system ATPase subunit